jgi:hypothetical protein
MQFTGITMTIVGWEIIGITRIANPSERSNAKQPLDIFYSEISNSKI